MSRVVVIGSANMDLVARAPRLPAPGETIAGTGFFQTLGGKGANQAVAAARAGASVEFVAALGDDDHGRAAHAQFRREGLGLDHVKIISGSPTGVALITVGSAGMNTIVVVAGANAALGPAEIEALPGELFARGNVVVLQLETPFGAVAAALARARKGGAFAIVNPAPATAEIVSAGLLANADLLVPNESEAEALTGFKIETPADAHRAAEQLIMQGCRAVIVTLGERGCCTLTDADVQNHAPGFQIPAREAAAVDTVGAGDAFIGALAAWVAAKLGGHAPNPEALRAATEFATRAAALSVQRPGAQASMPYLAEIEAD